jgi:predicted kinase
MSGNLIDIHRKLFKDGHTDLNFEDWLALFESDQDVQDDAYSKYTGEPAGTNEQAAWNSNLFIKSDSSSDIKTPKKIEGPLNPEYIKKMDKDGDGYFDNTQSVVNGYLMPIKEEKPKLGDEDWTLEGMLGNTTDLGKYLKPKTEQEEQVGKDNDYYNNFINNIGAQEIGVAGDVPDGMVYSAERGFVEIDRLKAEYKHEYGEIAENDPVHQDFFNTWLRDSGFSLPSDMNTLRIKAKTKQIEGGLSDNLNPDNSISQVFTYLNDDFFKGSNANITFVQPNTNRSTGEVMLHFPTLIGKKDKNGQLITDKNGNIYISSTTLEDKNFRSSMNKKLIQLRKMIEERQKLPGGTASSVIDMMFMDVGEEQMKTADQVRGNVELLGNNTAFQSLVLGGDEVKINNKLSYVNDKVLVGTGMKVSYADQYETEGIKHGHLKLYDSTTGETYRFRTPADLQKHLSDTVSIRAQSPELFETGSNFADIITENALKERKTLYVDPVNTYKKESKKETVTYADILKVYEFKDDIFRTKEGDKEYQQIASEADEYLRSTINAGEAPDLQGFKDSLNKGYISNNAPSPYGDPAPRGAGYIYSRDYKDIEGIFAKIQLEYATFKAEQGNNELHEKVWDNRSKTYAQKIRNSGISKLLSIDFKEVLVEEDGKGNKVNRIIKDSDVKDEIDASYSIVSDLISKAEQQVSYAVANASKYGYTCTFAEDGKTVLVEWDKDMNDGKEDPNSPAVKKKIMNDVYATFKGVKSAESQWDVERSRLDDVHAAYFAAKGGDDELQRYLDEGLGINDDYWSVARARFGRGKNSIIYGVGSLLGNEHSKDVLKADASAGSFEKQWEWDDPETTWYGYSGMVLADQGANFLLMAGTTGFGTALNLGAKGSMALVSSAIGVSTAGTKLSELERDIDYVPKALEQIKANESYFASGMISEEQYKETKIFLENIVDRGSLTEAQKWGSALMTGAVEGGLTYAFGNIGSLNTANNLVRAVVGNTSRNAGKGIMAYNGYRGIQEVVTGVTRGAIGEMTEEASIYLATGGFDSVILDRDWDTSQMSKVLRDAAILSGGMNTTSLGYMTIMNHTVRKELAAEWNQEFSEIKSLQEKRAGIVGNGKEQQQQRDAITTEIASKWSEHTLQWSKANVDALGMSDDDMKALFENGRVLTQKFLEAGVQPGDKDFVINRKLDRYKSKLNQKSRGSGDTWMEGVNDLRKTAEDVKSKTDISTAENSIYGDGKNPKNTKKNRDKIREEIKSDPKLSSKYNKQDERGKLAMELEFIYEKTQNEAIKEIKKDEIAVSIIERQVFSDRDESGKVLIELNRKDYETKYGKVSKKKDKLLEAYYRFHAKSHISGSGRDMVNLSSGKYNAQQIAQRVKDITGNDLQIVNAFNYDGLINEVNNSDLSPNEKNRLKEQLEKNKNTAGNSNGFILGNKWVVINAEKARKALDNTDFNSNENFITGSVYMHEMGHYLANLTMSEAQISARADLLYEYMKKNKIWEAASNQAIKKVQGLRNEEGESLYDTSKSFSEQIDSIKDEYTRELQSILSGDRFASTYNEILKGGSSLRSKFSSNESFDVRTGKDAAFELVSNIEAFRKGDLSLAVKTRLTNLKKWRDRIAEIETSSAATPAETKELAKLRKKVELSSFEQGDLQPSTREEVYINSFATNKDGSAMTKEQYDAALSGRPGIRRKGKDGKVKRKLTPADLLLDTNNTLNGSIRNLGTRIVGDNVSGFSIEEFFTAVKSELTQAIIKFDPEVNENFSGWIAQHILWKKPGVIDDFRKRREVLDGEFDNDIDEETESTYTPEGTIIAAKMFNNILTGENVEKTVTRIVDENYNKLDLENIRDYKSFKKLVKDGDGALTEVLRVVAEKFGVDISKIINDVDLVKAERRAAQSTIYKIARETLVALPEGFDSSGKSTGVAPSILNAVNPETGEPNLLYTKQKERAPTVKKRIGRQSVTAKASGPTLNVKNFVDNINIQDYLGIFGITKVGVESRYRSDDKEVDGPIRALIVQMAMVVANQSVRVQAESRGNYPLVSRIKDGKSDLLFSVRTVLKSDINSLEFYSRAPELMKKLKKGFGQDMNLILVQKAIDQVYTGIYSEKERSRMASEIFNLLGKYKFEKRGPGLDSKMERAMWNEFKSTVEIKTVANSILKLYGIDLTGSQVFSDVDNINRMRQSVNNFINRLLDPKNNIINPLTDKPFTREDVLDILVILQPMYAGATKLSTGGDMDINDDGYAYGISKEKQGEKGTQRYQSTKGANDWLNNFVLKIEGVTEDMYKAAAKRVSKNAQKAGVRMNDVDENGIVSAEKAELIKLDARRAQVALELFYDMLLADKKTYSSVDRAMFLISNLSHMEAPMRRAATFSNVGEGMTKPGHKNFIPKGKGTPAEVSAWMKENGYQKEYVDAVKKSKADKIDYRNKYTVVYEHVITASDMAYRLGYYKDNGKFFEGFWDKYTVAVIPRAMDDTLKAQGLLSISQPGFNFLDPNSDPFGRYYGPLMWGFESVIPVVNIFDGTRKGDSAITMARILPESKIKENEDNKIIGAAMQFSRRVNPSKGISVFDLDDTLATTKSGVRYTLPNPDGTPQPKKKVIFMAGGPGSGKSNVINQLGLKEQGFKVVNQDISLEWLMKNHGMPTDMREFTPEQASEFGKLSAEARGIALKKRIKYQGEGDGVIIDGTGASLNVMKKNIQDFKDKGYDVQMIFVETSQETALSRNKARKERSLRTGIVIKTHDSVQANKEAYKELFGERFAEVNTDNLEQGDAMPADVVNKVNDFTSGYIKGRLNAGEYATKGEELKQQGAEFDFSEFNQIIDGKTAPMFEKAMKLQGKFGNKDMFVLTARPAESAQSIFEFLQANGLNIPIDNIVGLGSSLSSDKALWMAGKVGEGYNDFYFADDILENVQAVSDMLAQFDVKSKVQQARRDFVLGDPKVTRLLDEKSMSDVKDVDGLANPGVYSNIQFSRSHRAEYENTVAKNRPDLSGKEVTATIDRMFEYINGLDVPNKRKYEQITTKWLATSNIKLPEDSYKIQQAVEIAELKKEDIFSYKNPNEIIEKYAGTIKVKPISPDGVKEFTRATGFNDPITTEYGIVEYEVEETREAQQKVRDIVNTHWGPNSNPWCITKIDKDGNLSEDAWRDWTSYGKGPKRIVFQNGKLLAVKANYEYWGKMNKHSEGPIIQVKEGKVTNTTELIVGDGGIVDPIIRETRTVSKDGNTVTTNIFENSQDGYAEGTTIVENRIKGVKTKETRFDPDGSKVNTQEFNKKGKPTTSYQFNPNGKVKSVNGHLQQQAITEAGLDVNAREDADIDLTNELVVRVGDVIENNYTEAETDGTTTDYFYGRALVGDQVMEIGFESKTGLDLADVTKTVNGKTRLDIGKVLREVDPDVKGLPNTGIMFSQGISRKFNDIIEQSTGVGSEKVFSNAQAKIRGNKRRFDNIVPYSVQDLMGLLYNFVGKGKVGEQHMEFFKKALIDPFARAINELNRSKQSSAGDYSNLTKAFPNVKKKLNKEIEGGDYTYDQAIRVYLWNKAGFEVPGLSKRDLNALDSIVKNDPELQAFADTLGLISKKEEGYAKPGEYWLVENIASDLLSDGSIGDARSEFLAEWQQNADEMFSKENLNKIQAIYGNKFREALEDILYRMKHGTNRPTGSSRLTNNFMNWINNSTGAIMFFNMRSALLQTLSTTNYINWTDNNPLKAAMAFANQKQYWSDFSALFNSDFLKQRRSGNQRSINEAELTTAVANSDNKAKAAIAWLLQKGFLPTQIMDSFAISAGGATFYRNRVNKYIKEGMTPEQAQEKAFLDFQEITEATQQSARPDMISQQQASPLGRLILSFQNTPMQYARIMNKAARDIVNGRGDQKSNISKIAYYGAIQSIIFASLQTAIFAALGDDEEEEFDKKKQRIVNSMVDGWLAGLGVAGKAIGTIERSIKEYLKQKERGFNADHAQTIIQLLGFSPPIGSKVRKIYGAIQTEQLNKGVSERRGLTLDNPTWSSWGNVIEGFTNIPLGRMANKMLNIDNALDSQNEWWERAALLLGWNTWDLGIKDPDIEAVRGEIKEEKKIEQKRISKEKARIKKEEKDKKLEKENANKEKANLELQKKEREAGKKVICAAVSIKGERCKKKIERGSTYCTIHDKVEQNESGKKSQCKKVKNDGKKCKVKTSNKSGYCYYHD